MEENKVAAEEMVHHNNLSCQEDCGSSYEDRAFGDKVIEVYGELSEISLVENNKKNRPPLDIKNTHIPKNFSFSNSSLKGQEIKNIGEGNIVNRLRRNSSTASGHASSQNHMNNQVENEDVSLKDLPINTSD